jgi:hypothetical protein
MRRESDRSAAAQGGQIGGVLVKKMNNRLAGHRKALAEKTIALEIVPKNLIGG